MTETTVTPLTYYLCYPNAVELPYVDAVNGPQMGNLSYGPQVRSTQPEFTNTNMVAYTEAEYVMAMLMFMGQAFAQIYCQDIDIEPQAPIAAYGYGVLTFTTGTIA